MTQTNQHDLDPAAPQWEYANPLALQEQLNADFTTFVAAHKGLAADYAPLGFVPVGASSSADTVPTVETKVNAVIKALNAATGKRMAYVHLDSQQPQWGGFTPESAAALRAALVRVSRADGDGELGELGLKETQVSRNIPFRAKVAGATAVSSLAAQGLPTGLVLSSAQRVVEGSATGQAGVYPVVITETLGDAQRHHSVVLHLS